MKFKYKIIDLLDKKIIEEAKSFDEAKELLNTYSERNKKNMGIKYEKIILCGILREVL